MRQTRRVAWGPQRPRWTVGYYGASRQGVPINVDLPLCWTCECCGRLFADEYEGMAHQRRVAQSASRPYTAKLRRIFPSRSR